MKINKEKIKEVFIFKDGVKITVNEDEYKKSKKEFSYNIRKNKYKKDRDILYFKEATLSR